jgi:hypothetical protein
LQYFETQKYSQSLCCKAFVFRNRFSTAKSGLNN